MDENKEIIEKIRGFEQEYKKLLEKYDLEMKIEMEFPQYRILPKKLELALEILFDEGLEWIMTYKEKK